jgi:predicted acylesterase/phospholipase RssA
MKTAVNVVGGGAAGFVTAPYLEALEERGIIPDEIHGASSGAISAAVYLSAGAAGLRELWLRIRDKDVYRDNLWTWSGLLDKRAACYDSSPLDKLIEQYVDEDKIRQSASKLFISVTNVESERCFSINLSSVKGPLHPWIYASASPPVLFPQVEISGRKYFDGGLGELINLSYAVKNGADRIIVLCPRGPVVGGKVQSGIEALKFVIRMPLNYMLEKELRLIEIMNGHPDKRHIDTLIIRPLESNQPGILNFDDLGTLSERKRAFQFYKSQALSALDKLGK